MLYSLAFVIYGVFRYFYLIHVKKQGGDPGEIVLSDMPLLFGIILWAFFVTAVLLASGVAG